MVCDNNNHHKIIIQQTEISIHYHKSKTNVYDNNIEIYSNNIKIFNNNIKIKIGNNQEIYSNFFPDLIHLTAKSNQAVHKNNQIYNPFKD